MNVTGRPIITQSSWNLGPVNGGVGDTSEIARYMEMVAPISAETWITVHRRVFIESNPKPIFPGNAHQTVATAVSDAQYWLRKGKCVYLSQGMFRNPGEPGKMYPQANRDYDNLVVCKNLYIDVDVKEDGGYPSTQEAARAVKGFLEWSSLPMPSVIVGSGSGGFHLYWTLDIAVDRKEFANMAGRLISASVAYGLLFDRQCTRDATRLLRVAGTLNFKFANENTPATKVKLLQCGREHVNADLMQASLSRWPVTVVNPAGKSRGSANGNANARGGAGMGGVDAHGLPLDENADLTGGMGGKREYAPVSIDEVAVHCPFIKNTLEAGGANLVGDPQWHTVVALSCHVTNPRETAHRLCNKSQYYTEEGTDEKLATAQLARANRETIGPPKCDHIAIEREECKTCPHLALDTTPLSVGFKFNPAGKAPGKGAPPVGGRILTSALPPQTLWDTPGNRAQIMEALDLRLAADPYIFQNANRLISLRVSPGPAQFANIVDHSRSAAGEAVTTPAVRDEGDMPAMLETTDADVMLLADQDYWMSNEQGRPTAGKSKTKRVHASGAACRLYVNSARARTGFRPLLGLARVPIIDDAGNLDFGIGYHEATGIFRDRTPLLDIPDNPTDAEVKRAIITLMTPFQSYEFEDPVLGRDLTLTTIFTALERPFLPTAPAIVLNGESGIGKGKYLKAVAQRAFDTSPRFMTYGFSDEEFDKRIATMFRYPAACMGIDNVNDKLVTNQTLESIISEGHDDIRLLGKTEPVHVENRSFLAILGRGVSVGGDMVRRSLTIDLISKLGAPASCSFNLDPPTYVTEHRIELLTAAYTIMRAYRRAGMPRIAKTSIGSFERWERYVRDLIVWLTGRDLADQFINNQVVASDRQASTTLLHALHNVYARTPFYAGEVMSWRYMTA